MVEVRFYDQVEDDLLRFAVIIARHQGQWVFCKHRERKTYECPGGHREAGESIDDAAKRELWEETGAAQYHIQPICVYSVLKDGIETFGKLYFADIHRFDPLPPLEIEKVTLCTALPTAWTYPDIQPKLLVRCKAL